MMCDLIVYKDQYRAFNEALILSGIKVNLFRYDPNSDWNCEIDTSEHDNQVRADVIKPFEDLYNHHICIDYDFPTMPMLMDFYNHFKDVLKEQK